MKLESLPNSYGDEKASHKIVKDLKERFDSRKLVIKSSRSVSKLPFSSLGYGARD